MLKLRDQQHLVSKLFFFKSICACENNYLYVFLETILLDAQVQF